MNRRAERFAAGAALATSRSLLTDATNLEDSCVVIEVVRLFSSPSHPRFLDWALKVDRGAPLREKFARAHAINASCCDVRERARNAPIVVDL